jgi:hypothetical protein
VTLFRVYIMWFFGNLRGELPDLGA